MTLFNIVQSVIVYMIMKGRYEGSSLLSERSWTTVHDHDARHR